MLIHMNYPIQRLHLITINSIYLLSDEKNEKNFVHIVCKNELSYYFSFFGEGESNEMQLFGCNDIPRKNMFLVWPKKFQKNSASLDIKYASFIFKIKSHKIAYIKISHKLVNDMPKKSENDDAKKNFFNY